jgi:DDE family transposase
MGRPSEPERCHASGSAVDAHRDTPTGVQWAARAADGGVVDVPRAFSVSPRAPCEAPMTGKRGAQPIDTDIAIETALTLRLLLHLPLRQTEGFLGSILRLMDLSLPCPDHTTWSRRHATVRIRQQVDPAPPGPIDLSVDSTG